MLGRRRVFAVKSLGGQGETGGGLECGCVVPGVTSTYRRIPEAAHGCSSDPRKGEEKLRGLERRVPLLKLASRDSGVEMVIEDSPVASPPELSQDSLNLETMGSRAPPGQLGRLLTSRKLEQVLERSGQLPNLYRKHCSWQPLSRTEQGAPFFGAGEREATKAETELEAGVEEAEVVGGTGPTAWACLPGQGLRYLEHLCVVLEHTARLQQLYLQLQTQSSPAGPDEDEVALAPLPLLSLGNGLQGPMELLSQTKETGEEAASPPKVEVLSANPQHHPPRLPEAPVERTHSFPASQRHKDLSHWDKVKILLHRIRWRSPRHCEPPAPPDGSVPTIESRDFFERPQCHPHQKTFMPSLVAKKTRTKNFSVC